jgi:hypothetical protein
MRPLNPPPPTERGLPPEGAMRQIPFEVPKSEASEADLLQALPSSTMVTGTALSPPSVASTCRRGKMLPEDHSPLSHPPLRSLENNTRAF